MEIESKTGFCWICQEEENLSEKWVKLSCKCRGTMEFIHKDCLIMNLGVSKSKICPTCKTEYKSTFSSVIDFKLILIHMKKESSFWVAFLYPFFSLFFLLILISQILILSLNFFEISFLGILFLIFEIGILIFLFKIPIYRFRVYFKLLQTGADLEKMREDPYFSLIFSRWKIFIETIKKNLREKFSDPTGTLVLNMFYQDLETSNFINFLKEKINLSEKQKKIFFFFLYGYLFWVDQKLSLSFSLESRSEQIEKFIDGFIYE